MSDDTPNMDPVVPAGHVRVDEGEPLPRLDFEDKGAIKDEPITDVRIETASGLVLRERMIEVAASADATLSSEAAPTSRSIVISNALLDDAGAVMRDEDGRPRLSTRHEVVLTNEALGRLGTTEAVEAAIDDARRIAAAKADIEFRGMALHDQILAGRTRHNQGA